MAAVQASSFRQMVTLAAAVALALPALTGCSEDAEPQSAGTTPPTRSTSATPTPTPAEQVLSGLAAAGVAAQFTGTYALDSIEPDRPDAEVTIYRLDSSYRVDVVRGDATSILMTTADGLVSCQVQGKRRTCLRVGEVGQPPPELFDPGLQRLFTSDLAALVRGDDLTVTPSGTLPEEGALPTATCFRASGEGVDPGEYCLTETGILRRAQFPSGTLELTELRGAPAATAFRPPVEPTPLPS